MNAERLSDEKLRQLQRSAQEWLGTSAREGTWDTDAEYIASCCSPEVVSALASELLSLRSEVAEARKNTRRLNALETKAVHCVTEGDRSDCLGIEKTDRVDGATLSDLADALIAEEDERG